MNPSQRNQRLLYVNAAEFQSNPRTALRQAKSQPVVVMSQAQPEVVITGLHVDSMISMPGVRSALPQLYTAAVASHSFVRRA